MPSLSDKQMEERLKEAGNRLLLRPPASSDELLPILDQIEELLSKVEQSPAKSMQTALSPLMKAMTVEDLLTHPDSDVRAAVAACISEITRITAPDAPYEDEKMKEIFRLIVSSFQNLSDTSSRSHEKRAAILETVAKVRSCVIMLDLECEELIIQMFQHFLKSIRDDHAEVIFTSMETIMTLVFDESEDISSDLIYPILAILKRDNESIPPIARKLAEKVILNCADKIRPYLVHAIKSLDAMISDYGEVVASVCQENVVLLGNNNQNILEEQQASKDGREDKDLTLCEPPNLINSSPDQSAAEDNMTIPKSDSHDLSAQKCEKLEEKKDDFETQNGPENYRSSGEDLDVSRGQVKIEVVKPLKKFQGTAVPRPPSKESENEVVEVASPTKSNSLHDESQSVNDHVANVNDNFVQEETTCDSQPDRTCDVEAVEKPRSGEGQPDKKSAEEISSTQDESVKDVSNSDSEEKMLDQKGVMAYASNKMEDISSLNKKTRKKNVRAKPKNAKDAPRSPMGENNAKGTVASPISPIISTKDKDNNTPRTSTKRKRTPSTEKASKNVEYGKNLVGSTVKIWWAMDRRYYEGVIDSFDSIGKKHKILYTDGDVEVLNLKREQWEFVGDDLVLEGDQAVEHASHDASSGLQPTGGGDKTSLATSSKRKKIEGSPKRKGKDSAKSRGSPIKDEDEPKANKSSAKSEPKTNKSSAKSPKTNKPSAKSGPKANKSSAESEVKSSKLKNLTKDSAKATPSSSKQDSQKTAKSKGKTPQSTGGSGARLTRSSGSSKAKEIDQSKSKGTVSEQKSSVKTKKNSAKSRESETKKEKKRKR